MKLRGLLFLQGTWHVYIRRGCARIFFLKWHLGVQAMLLPQHCGLVLQASFSCHPVEHLAVRLAKLVISATSFVYAPL